MSKYSLVPKKVWKRREGFSGCPKYVSIHGALPSPREAYEIQTEGFSIYNSDNNTYSNYFFGKAGISSEKEGMEIISKLK